MDSSSYGAHACMLGARFGVRAAEVGHLAVLSAHGCMACRVNVQRGDHVLIVVQDRALIKQNLRPTVGQKKKIFGHRRGIKKTRLGATV
jgi:hypothetical protein